MNQSPVKGRVDMRNMKLRGRTYSVRVEVDGKEKWKTTKQTDPRLARIVADEILAKVRETGVLPPKVPRLKQWYETFAADLRESDDPKDAERLAAYRVVLPFVDLHGDLPLDKITTGLCRQYAMQRLRMKSRYGRVYGPATVRHECAMVQALIQKAIDDLDLAFVNPWLGIKKKKLIKGGGVRRRTPTIAELRRLIAALPRAQDQRAVVFLSETGVRRTEFLGIQPADIVETDHGRLLRVRAETAKNSKQRSVPFLAELEPLLAEQLLFRGIRKDSKEPLWAYGHLNQLLRHIATACKRAGLEKIWIHDLRRVFTRAAWRKASPWGASNAIGHENLKTTETHYHNLTGDEEELLAAYEGVSLGFVDILAELPELAPKKVQKPEQNRKIVRFASKKG